MHDSQTGSRLAGRLTQPPMLRGMGMGAVLVAARIGLSSAIEQWPLHATGLRFTALAIVVALAAAWGTLDGRRDRARNPDPEHSDDLTMRWLTAGLLAGLFAGLAVWMVGRLSTFDLGNNSMLFEITSGAGWSMLLVLVAATAGFATGRLWRARKSTTAPA